MNLSGDPRIASAGQAAPGAGEPRDPVRATPACPTDAEWGGIRSAEALEKAYARAGACYAAQARTGRRWDEIR